MQKERDFVIARGSVIEIDTAFDIAQELGYTTILDLQTLGYNIIQLFKLLSGLINQSTPES